MTMKYVRGENTGFILSPKTDRIWHSHVSRLFRGEDIVSAGFVDFEDGKPKCYGRSETLNLDSKPDDGEALARQLGL